MHILNESILDIDVEKDLISQVNDLIALENISNDIYVNHDAKLVIEVYQGDWKHDHARLDYLMRKFFNESTKYKLIDNYSVTTDEDGSDTYSADHYYTFEIVEE